MTEHVREADDLTDPDEQEAVALGMLAEREARERIRRRTQPCQCCGEFHYDPDKADPLGCLVDAQPHTCGYEPRLLLQSQSLAQIDMTGVMCTDYGEATYGCETSMPGNCPCDDDNCENSPHSYEHVCIGDEFHDGRHQCCCGRNWLT